MPHSFLSLLPRFAPSTVAARETALPAVFPGLRLLNAFVSFSSNDTTNYTSTYSENIRYTLLAVASCCIQVSNLFRSCICCLGVSVMLPFRLHLSLLCIRVSHVVAESA